MAAPGSLDALIAAAKSQVFSTQAPTASTNDTGAGSLASLIAGAKSAVPPNTNALVENMVPGGHFLAGLGHAAENFKTGAEQLWNSTGNLDAWVAKHLPKGALADYEARAAADEKAKEAALQTRAASEAQAWQDNPNSQTFGAKAGEFVGNALPFMVSPGLGGLEDAGLAARLAVPATRNAAIGALAGAAQPIAPGQSRIGNAVASGIGAVAGGLAGQAMGAGLRTAGHVLIPALAKRAGEREAAALIAEKAPAFAANPARAETAYSRITNAVPGLKPDTASVAQSNDLASVARLVAQDPRFSGKFVDTAQNNQAAILNALGGLGNTTSPQTDVAAGIGKTLNNIASGAHDQEDALWSDKNFLSQKVNISRLQQGLENWRQSLPVSDRNKLPQWPFDDLSQIAQENGPQAPLSEIKSLRSNILREARNTSAPTQAAHLNSMAHELLNQLGNGQGFTEPEVNAGNAYRQATQFTKQMHANLAPLQPALTRAEFEESRVAPWLINTAAPAPERLDAYLKAANQYLGDKNPAPQAARDYFVNVLTKSVMPRSPNVPVSGGALTSAIKRNWPIIQKLYPDKTRQNLIKDIGEAARAAEFTSNAKVADRGPDTAQKLLGNAWLSENLGHGVHLGGVWSRMAGWVLSLPEKQKMTVLSEALQNPGKAAYLVRKYSAANVSLASKVFKIGKRIPAAALPAYGARAITGTVQPLNQ